MWIEEISAEELARLFHHYRGALARDFDGSNGQDSACSWDRAPQSEKKLMVAAARLALLELATAPKADEAVRPYFAKAGEAEWGC